MMARNIPPGLSRYFRIESLPFHEREILKNVKEEAKSKIYPSGKYEIFANDMSEEMVEVAKRNAERAGVGDDITFNIGNYLHTLSSTARTIITNPPYGKRLESDDLDAIYKKLIKEVKENG